jgi:hypothetical protein
MLVRLLRIGIPWTPPTPKSQRKREVRRFVQRMKGPWIGKLLRYQRLTEQASSRQRNYVGPNKEMRKTEYLRNRRIQRKYHRWDAKIYSLKSQVSWLTLYIHDLTSIITISGLSRLPGGQTIALSGQSQCGEPQGRVDRKKT